MLYVCNYSMVEDMEVMKDDHDWDLEQLYHIPTLPVADRLSPQFIGRCRLAVENEYRDCTESDQLVFSWNTIHADERALVEALVCDNDVVAHMRISTHEPFVDA